MKKVIVHAPGCFEAGDAPVIAAKQADPYAVPHYCIPGGFATATVVEVAVEVPDHEWKVSMIWPAGAPESLCRDCRQPKAAHEEVTV